MLETLTIKNIAVIDSCEIHFKSGLNILSGETGAGKSIVIEAIALILGGRANTDLIRSSADEGLVEGSFNIKFTPWIHSRLENKGISGDQNQLIIRRVVHRQGRHRIYVNDTLVSLNTLQSICSDLIDLFGQSEHQSLMRSSTQFKLLDRFSGNTQTAREYEAHHKSYKLILDKKTELLAKHAETLKLQDFIQFQIEELQKAELKSGEDEQLVQEKTLLHSRKQSQSAYQQACDK